MRLTFDIFINLFKRVSLKTNAKKTQVMICIPGKISESWSNKVYHNSRLGLTSSTEPKCLRVDCNICGERLLDVVSKSGKTISAVELLNTLLEDL